MKENESISLRPVQPESMSMSLKQVTDRVNMVHGILQKVMKDGTHYGKVPGCGARMVLFKPGADLLAMTFRLVPSFSVETTNLPNDHREFSVTCSMTAPDGTLLGQGVGSASTMEKKYRYRKSEFGDKIENEDIADVYNTVLKMAKKRAHIDATLTVTGAADIFTQDIIEGGDDAAGGEAPIAEPKAKAARPASTSQPVDGEKATGVLEAVSEKGGESAKGKYVKFGLKVAGEWYGTFDAALGQAAKALKGEEVTVTWVLDGKYKTAKAVVLASSVTQGASVDMGGGDTPADAMAGLLPYASDFPKMFARGCEHVGLSVADWKSAPAEALVRLQTWLDAESARQ